MGRAPKKQRMTVPAVVVTSVEWDRHVLETLTAMKLAWEIVVGLTENVCLTQHPRNVLEQMELLVELG